MIPHLSGPFWDDHPEISNQQPGSPGSPCSLQQSSRIQILATIQPQEPARK